MKYSLFFIAFLICTHAFFSQERDIPNKPDSLYKEDQFYAGITYNLLSNKPGAVTQIGFSSGFHLGFIKDMPINKRRNIAIGLGIGYSANSFNHNMLINKNELGDVTYSILNESDVSYTKNKFSMHLVEIPLEFRWRTSTASEYKFWRIYTGFKLGYVLTHTTKFRGDFGVLKFSDIKDFNNLQYGLTLSIGYNTWNLYLYYTLNPIFSDDVQLNNKNLDMNVVKIGLMFYIL